MRIKTTTYRDVQQKPCQFYWHGLLHITIDPEYRDRYRKLTPDEHQMLLEYCRKRLAE
ncbi:MAG: hypothetical protein ACK5Y6_07055 [Pseudomonadota bacterium]